MAFTLRCQLICDPGPVRDEWESHRPEIEGKISSLLGETWTVSVNPNLIYVYTDDSNYKERLGSVIMW